MEIETQTSFRARENEENEERRLTYGYARGDEVAFVEDEQEMLVRRFLLDVFLHAAASRSFWISRVQDVEDDVRGVDDFVQLVPYPLALTFGEDGFASNRKLLLTSGAVSPPASASPDRPLRSSACSLRSR